LKAWPILKKWTKKKRGKGAGTGYQKRFKEEMMAERKYGFIALWKHSDAWYAADPEEKKKLIDKVNEINREAHGFV
jgi:hypothetical protein